jgi:hypothetical protein
MGTETGSVNAMFGVSSDNEEQNEILERHRNRRDENEDYYDRRYYDDYREEKPVDSRGVIGDGIIDTPEELMDREVNVSFIKWNFWDLWLQKVFRNFASMKFQLLILLYIPVIWGMFNFKPETKDPWISATVGLSFLGGGYVTLATSRYLSRTGLVEKNGKKFDTDQ